MSYTSIKRVLGETSLERKIRILFGISLLALIAVAFLSVNRITEKQIIENTRSKASSDIEYHLLRVHYKNMELRADMPSQDMMIANALAELGKTREFEASALVLSDQVGRVQLKPEVVKDDVTMGHEIDRARNELEELNRRLAIDQGLLTPELQKVRKNELANKELEIRTLEKKRMEYIKERELLAGLETIFRPQQAVFDLAREKPVLPLSSVAIDSKNHLFPDQFLEDNWYAYYEPIVFSTSCQGCHYLKSPNPKVTMALTSGDQALLDEETKQLVQQTVNEAPTVFVRVKLPYQIAKQSINRSRAILMAVAIVTAFLSMLALYLIVRYVIVKPLKHLRDVADEVSHGKMDVRSDLLTGDEFEELSRSFNKMLRHLLDTHKELQDANDDLDRKVDEQAQLNLKLHEMNQVKSEFLANMSHELRTPLNSIIGFSEILGTSGTLEGREKRYASNIHRSGRLLLDLINDILDLAKLEAGKMEINPSSFQIQQLIVELCDIVRKLAEDKNIHLYAEVEPALPDVFQDQTKIRQILINLLSNAIKFTPEGGRIRVSARKEEGEELLLEVDDTGIGISDADRGVIFEKFRQGPTVIGGNTLTREVAGTGLGLSIVRELCILLGGSITVSSEVGKGSTFTVRLPWNAKAIRKNAPEVTRTLEEMTKVSKIDFGRASRTPQPSAEELAEIEPDGMDQDSAEVR